MRPVPRPTELELLANLLLGPDTGVTPLPSGPAGGVPAALEHALLAPLQREPCVVSFSGGRDSSAVLAVAAEVARRHGLPLPVPVTMRFPDQPATQESEWQELVLEHLGLRAETITLTDELDALGPAATDGLRRVGVRWPANTYVHAPVLELARGGSLLTGVGGDELLGTQGALWVRTLWGRARPRPRALAAELLPRRGAGTPYSWLTPRGEAAVNEVLARDDASWPPRWDRALDHWHRSRAFAAVAGAIALYAEPYDVAVVQPLLDPSVLAALRRAGGAAGWASRADAMRRLFGHLLPPELITRETKAAFSAALFGPATRAFAEDWDGTGVDPERVDVGALREVWRTERDDFRSVLLLQHAWLAAQPSASS
jgi:asparagine synthase (glutamine-hydrolysing)